MSSERMNEGNLCMRKAGLVTGSGVATYDTTNIITFMLNGKAYVEAGATTGGTTPTTDGVSGSALALTGTSTSGQGLIVVWCIDSALAHKVLFGQVSSIDKYGNWDRYPQPPSVPSTLVPFAYQVIQYYGTAGTFTFGTSNWDASGATVTAVDVLLLPKRPTIT